jgi:hypothetical protein
METNTNSPWAHFHLGVAHQLNGKPSPFGAELLQLQWVIDHTSTLLSRPRFR